MRVQLGCSPGRAGRETDVEVALCPHQGMAQKIQFGFLANALVQQTRLGIRGAGVRFVAPALPPEVHRRIARIVVRGRR